jgi:predicted ribosome quality control (RQC) complex YloA/Tae2 family protein
MIDYTFEYEGHRFEILIGANKAENWKLIDLCDDADIWFHLRDHPSAHVVLRNSTSAGIRQIPRQVIKRCAVLCKIKSTKESRACPVIYTFIGNLSRGRAEGSVMAENTKEVFV